MPAAFTAPFVSCPTGTTRQRRAPMTLPDECEFPDLISRLALDHEATRMAVFVRSAESHITLTQRAPAFWDLSAESTLTLTQQSGRLRIINAEAETLLELHQGTTVAGGRVCCTVKCVDQVAHGFSVEDWIVLDKTSQEWTEAFDPAGDIESDAVAMVVAVESPNRFCFRPIGPISELAGPLTPGETYYVKTDGSGDVSTTEPTGDTSVPRLFAISTTEAIVLPYRPLDPSSVAGGRVQEVFDVDAGIVSSKQVTLANTPVEGTEDVHVNGNFQTRGSSRDYTISGTVITFTTTVWDLKVGDLITVRYNATT